MITIVTQSRIVCVLLLLFAFIVGLRSLFFSSSGWNVFSLSFPQGSGRPRRAASTNLVKSNPWLELGVGEGNKCPLPHRMLRWRQANLLLFSQCLQAPVGLHHLPIHILVTVTSPILSIGIRKNWHGQSVGLQISFLLFQTKHLKTVATAACPLKAHNLCTSQITVLFLPLAAGTGESSGRLGPISNAF